MKCDDPIIMGAAVFGCGTCLSCRINRRRVWSHRITLESRVHDFSSFVTLTYDEGNVPLTSRGLHTLEPDHLKNWLKRYRQRILPERVRYYACGEYGDDTFRPHYHVVLFGRPSCAYGVSRKHRLGNGKSCCSACDLVMDTWRKGCIETRPLDAGLADYIAGYVTKKMTRSDDARLEGRWPEFARMSLNPGVGAGAIPAVAAVLKHYGLEFEGDDVLWKLDHSGKGKLLGRYLRGRLREETGREKPDRLPAKFQSEMLELLEVQKGDPESSLKKEMVAKTETSRASLKARHKLFASRRTL